MLKAYLIFLVFGFKTIFVRKYAKYECAFVNA